MSLWFCLLDQQKASTVDKAAVVQAKSVVIPLRGLDLAPLPAAEHRDAAGDLGSEGAASLFPPEEVLPERHRFRLDAVAFWSSGRRS